MIADSTNVTLLACACQAHEPAPACHLELCAITLGAPDCPLYVDLTLAAAVCRLAWYHFTHHAIAWSLADCEHGCLFALSDDLLAPDVGATLVKLTQVCLIFCVRTPQVGDALAARQT